MGDLGLEEAIALWPRDCARASAPVSQHEAAAASVESRNPAA
jgi:hypothetical protein